MGLLSLELLHYVHAPVAVRHSQHKLTNIIHSWGAVCSSHDCKRGTCAYKTSSWGKKVLLKEEYQDVNESEADNSSRIKRYFPLFPKRQLSSVKSDKVLKPGAPSEEGGLPDPQLPQGWASWAQDGGATRAHPSPHSWKTMWILLQWELIKTGHLSKEKH